MDTLYLVIAQLLLLSKTTIFLADHAGSCSRPITPFGVGGGGGSELLELELSDDADDSETDD
jgi:hypothetical protein